MFRRKVELNRVLWALFLTGLNLPILSARVSDPPANKEMGVALAQSPTLEPAPGGGAGSLEKLMTDADVIALVKILSTDYTATAADGPMYGEAKVLKVVKGKLSTRTVRFGASAWAGPTHKKKECRIVFLSWLPAQHEYYQKTRWSSLETGKIDLFFTREALESWSEASLLDFLRRIQDAGHTPPKMELTFVQKSGRTTYTLSIRLLNGSDQTLWLSPSRIKFSFEALDVRYSRAIDWDGDDESEWLAIGPGATLAGVVSFGAKEVRGADEMTIMISHSSARFPHLSWIGFQSARVSLRNASPTAR